MAASQKKVIVRRFLGDSLAGYLPVLGFVGEGTISLLDLSGRLLFLPLSEVKFVAFVRNFDLNEAGDGDRLLRRSFLTRPRGEGLWLRVTFRTGDLLEGLAASDLALLDELLDARGLYVTPPDTRGNYQRIYIPRPAIAHLELLGVISAPSQRSSRTKQPVLQQQNELFDTREPG